MKTRIVGFSLFLFLCALVPLGVAAPSPYTISYSGPSSIPAGGSGTYFFTVKKDGIPQSGVTVYIYRRPETDSYLTNDTPVTDANGKVQTKLRLDSTASGTYFIRGAAADREFDDRLDTVEFNVTVGNSPPPPPPPERSTLVKISAGNQTAAPGDSVTLVVKLQDSDGNPISGVGLDFVFFGDDATASRSPQSGTTGADGRAQTTLTLSSNAQGEYLVEAHRSDDVAVYAHFTVTVGTSPPPPPPTPTTLEVISGDNQNGLTGEVLANPFVVEVRDQYDDPMEGVTVTFAISAGGGSLSVTTSMTNANGQAESTLTLGIDASTNTVTASVEGVSQMQVFRAEASLPPPIPTALSIVSGENQTGLTGEVLADPFVVEVRDQYDDPMEGVTVTFAISAGGGSLRPEMDMTNANGQAASTLTLGMDASTNTVTASVEGISQMQVFRAEASLPPPIPTTLSIVSGDNQNGLTGEVLANPFVVEVHDQYDDPMEGITVTFAINAGGGSLSVTTARTNADGQAESTLTLGANPGTNTVTVSVTGSQETRTFNAEGIRTPKKIEIISGDDQGGLPGAALEKPFVVEVQDQFDKPLPGFEVTFTVTAGGGTVQPEIAMTDENGRAESTLTLGSTPGTNTLRVSVAGNTQAVASLTIESVRMPMFTLSIPAGKHIIHIPLDVNQINGEDAAIDTVGDLYNVLGDAVNFIISLGTDGNWISYLGDESAGSAADAAIGDDTGLIAVMDDMATLEFAGDALGIGGASMINIDVGNNLVGVPLQPATGLSMISDLLVDGVGAIAVSKADGMGFHTIREPGQDGDGPIVGGVGYLVVYTEAEATSIPIVGSPWENSGPVSAAPAVAFNGTQTPVLYVEGGVMDEFNMLSRVPELRVTVKNLSTGASLDTVLGTELSTTAYSATFVELSRHAAKVGDVMEIVAHTTNPYVGVRPVPQIVVSAEEVLTSRISLPDMELYEIPSESELLANYPNPFNPETWIPYRLAQAAEVTLDIYDTNGRLVRTIDIGFKPAAVYESRASAIYWDGCNEFGEQVASGVYFYQLKVDNISFLRNMVILK